MVKKSNLVLLYFQAKEAKHFYLTTSNKHFKDEYLKYYAKYKKAGGKRKL